MSTPHPDPAAVARARAQVRDVRVVRVTADGANIAFGSLGLKLAAMRPGAFIALDTEFSGLSSDDRLRADDLRIRYAALRDLAHDRAVLSVGIAVFNPILPAAPTAAPTATDDRAEDRDDPTCDQRVTHITDFDVAVFDFLLCCDAPFSIAPDAGRFLVAHAFDFNALFTRGIPYTRASDATPPPPQSTASREPFSYAKLPRGLLWRLGRHDMPLVLHNGLFDIVLLYAAFQAPLPPTLPEFIDALLACAPAGFWDSKVLATSAGARASFLGHVFADAVLNATVTVRNDLPLPAPDVVNPPPDDAALANRAATPPEALCELFAFRGFCPRGVRCPFSHDPFKAVLYGRQGKAAKDGREAHKRHKAQAKALRRAQDRGVADVAKLSKKQKRRAAQTAAAVTTEASAAVAVMAAETQALTGAAVQSANGAADGSGRSDMSMKASPDGVAAAPTPLGTDADDQFGGGECHTAGWDAFCTGYAFAALRASLGADKLRKDKNYIALPNKLSNLLLKRSAYAYMDTVEGATPSVPTANCADTSSGHRKDEEPLEAKSNAGKNADADANMSDARR